MLVPKNQCGRSSGVERNLAKVEVEGSNPFARSKLKQPPKKKKLVSTHPNTPFLKIDVYSR